MKTKRKKDQGVHELTSLEVREVSIVDRPANGRRFSMIKNEDGDMNGEQRIEIDLNETADGDPSAETTPDELGAVFKSLGETLGDEKITKALAISEDAKGEARKVLARAMRSINTAYDAMYSAETTEDSAPTDFSKAVGSELVSIGAALAAMGKKLGGSKAVKTKKNEGGENAEDISFSDALVRVEEMITEVVRADVEKAGAKMASGRLKAFETAITQLTKLLDELKGKQETTKSEKVEAVTKLENELKVQKSKVAKQAIELKKLRTARGQSGALPVEKGDEMGEIDGDDESWPSDLNDDPASRKIDKSVDFR